MDGQKYCLKRMWMRKGSQSSLEFHLKKDETYIIEQGVLTVGLRDGRDRGRNFEVVLKPNDTFHIQPGLMHMRMARQTDTLILEVSTNDDPHDTYIVEDGHTYIHTMKEEEANGAISG